MFQYGAPFIDYLKFTFFVLAKLKASTIQQPSRELNVETIKL